MATANPVAPDWASASASADIDMGEDSDLLVVPGSSLFVEVVCRSRTDSASSFASQVSDGDELVANHNRMTYFERGHYRSLNILPCRPCSLSASRRIYPRMESKLIT